MVLIDNSIQSLPSTALLEIVADKEELEHQYTFMPVAILFKSAFDGISDTIATPRTDANVWNMPYQPDSQKSEWIYFRL